MNIQFIECTRTAFPTAPVAGPLVYDVVDNPPEIRYSEAFSPYESPIAYGGLLLYKNGVGKSYEVTLPAGYRRVIFEGYRDPNGSGVECFDGTQSVGTGTQNSAQADTGVYFDYLAPDAAGGRVIRLQSIAGAGPSFLANRVRITAT